MSFTASSFLSQSLSILSINFIYAPSLMEVDSFDGPDNHVVKIAWLFITFEQGLRRLAFKSLVLEAAIWALLLPFDEPSVAWPSCRNNATSIITMLLK